LHTLRTGVAYLLWIFGAWTAYVFLAYPLVEQRPQPSSTLLNEAVRFVIFAAPAFWLASREKQPAWRTLGLSMPTGKTMLTAFGVALVYGVIVSAIAAFQHKHFSPASIPLHAWFTNFSVSTLIEEIAFRGFLFHTFRDCKRPAVIAISSAAFAAIHFPGWWALGLQHSPTAWLSGTASIFFLGCVTGILFLRTRSVWATALVHATHNFLATAFV
jgi:membrane protease YdiL (CAAX protease family)